MARLDNISDDDCIIVCWSEEEEEEQEEEDGPIFIALSTDCGLPIRITVVQPNSSYKS